jgi:hypothetical protein
MEVDFGISTHGKQTVLYCNFEYIKDCVNKCGTISWRCRHYKRLGCKARLTTSEARVVSDRRPDHNHEGNIATSLARKAVGEMKLAVVDLMATPSSSQATVVANLDDHVLMALPKRSTLNRALQRRKKAVMTDGNGGIKLPAAPIDLSFDIPDRFADMVLFDSGPGGDRLIMIGSVELLDSLARADLWLADGTFKVVPNVFFQLYSMHFSFGSGITPAALYCLLSNKTAATYDMVLRQLKLLVPLAAPRKILVDFERAAMNAFSSAFPDATVTGCYFHLCQSVIRKVNEIGLKVEYETNNEVRGFVRCLPALAFVPADDVVEGFDLLCDSMPQNVDHLDELTSFFEHTYVRGRRLRGRALGYGPSTFPIELWNQHTAGVDGIARTTNAVEGWHHGLQALYQCHHPTVWTFLAGLQTDMRKNKTMFLQGATGVDHTHAKRYRMLNDRVQRAVAAFGRTEILAFLRSIAHLSHV